LEIKLKKNISSFPQSKGSHLLSASRIPGVPFVFLTLTPQKNKIRGDFGVPQGLRAAS